MSAVLLYGYGHLTRVAPGSMVDVLMKDFSVGAAALGNISAMYWYAYSIFQIPGGFLIDRFDPIKIMAVSSILCVSGGLLFSFAQSVELANVGRFLTGAGGASLYACCIKISHTWFNPKRFALLGGLIILIGMFGAAGGQAPLAFLIEISDWRTVMLWVAIAALPLGILVLLGKNLTTPSISATLTTLELLKLLRKAALSKEYWINTLFTMMIAGPATTFPVWGIAYYMQVKGYDRTGAAIFTTISLLGWAFGSLSAGWLSSKIQRHQRLAIVYAILAVVGWSIFISVPGLPRIGHLLVMLLIGYSAGGIVVGFILIANSCPRSLVGTATSISNTLVMLLSAIILLTMGYVLDVLWTGENIDGARIFSSHAFRMAYLVMPCVSIVALFAAMVIKEPARLYADRDIT